MSTSDETGAGLPNREPEDPDRFEYKNMRALRGMEARTIAKWESDGWELVAREAGPLMRTDMRFRRVWPKTLNAWVAQKVGAFQRLPLGQQARIGGIVAGVVVVLIVVAGVASSLGGGDDADPVAKTPAATSTKPSPMLTPKATTPTTAPPTPKQTPKPPNSQGAKAMEKAYVAHLGGKPITSLCDDTYTNWSCFYDGVKDEPGYLQVDLTTDGGWSDADLDEMANQAGRAWFNFIGCDFRALKTIVVSINGLDHNVFRSSTQADSLC